MKLYYAPGACSLSPHIVLREAGIAFDLERVDLKTHRTANGADFHAVNAKGYVPVLELDGGERLTEGPAIVQYIADLKPESGLAPKAGTLARYRVMEWLNFITSEVHKPFGALFKADAHEAIRQSAREGLERRFEWLAKELGDKAFLTGETFTVADAYLFTVLNWGQWVGVDLARWPALKSYAERVAARPKVHEALKAERLVK